jgi:hypothetical protein
MDSDKLMSKLSAMGLDEFAVQNTVLFYGESDVSKGFRHKMYGFQKKNVGSLFAEHVQKGAALWFRNQPSPEKRCFEKQSTLREMAKEDSFLKMTLPIVMAHDYPGGKKEGGAKDYLLMSPWQFLNTITNTPSTNVNLSFTTFTQKNIEWPEPDSSWFKDGQPVQNFPRCSLYTHRYDLNASSSTQYYLLVIDVDGKCCMTEDEKKNKDEKAGNIVMKSFETDIGGDPARLSIIASIIKEELASLNSKVRPLISWHKTSGWKPSWRGYVTGALFRNVTAAKTFINSQVLPRLREEHGEWYAEGVVDDKTYSKGYDRCMGSAKINFKKKQEMRFMQEFPLESLSDAPLLEMFRNCPNEYFLRCLGLIYDPDISEDPFIGPVETDKERAVSKKRKLACFPSTESISDTTEVEEIVAEMLKKNKLSDSWRGNSSVRVSPDWVEIRPSGDSRFCVFKECEMQQGFTVATKKKIPEQHSMQNPGMVFRILFHADQKDPEKRFWLKQMCWSCADKSSHQKGSRYERVCPVDRGLVAQLAEKLQHKNTSGKRTKEKDTKKKNSSLQTLCIDFEFASI